MSSTSAGPRSGRRSKTSCVKAWCGIGAVGGPWWLAQDRSGTHRLTGFVEDMRVLGRIPPPRAESRGCVAAPLVAEKLAVPAGTRVVQIQRVRLSDGVPLSFDETYLPEDLGRRIMTDDLANEPIFTLLEERYDTPLVEAEYVLEAATAELAVATALEIPIWRPDLRDRADLLHLGTSRRGL